MFNLLRSSVKRSLVYRVGSRKFSSNAGDKTEDFQALRAALDRQEKEYKSERVKNFLLGTLSVASALYLTYTIDEYYRMRDSGSRKKLGLMEWARKRIYDFTGIECSEQIMSNEYLAQLRSLNPLDIAREVTLYQRIHNYPPNAENTEYTTQEVFTNHTTLPVHDSSTNHTAPRAMSLLGAGLRSMLNMYWLPMTRAYTYGVYIDTLDYLEHFGRAFKSEIDPSAASTIEFDKNLAYAFARAASKAVVLRFAQSTVGDHISHGFQRTFGNRLLDSRVKTNFFGQSIAIDGDCGLEIEANPDNTVTMKGVPYTSPNAQNTNTTTSLVSKFSLRNLFGKKSSNATGGEDGSSSATVMNDKYNVSGAISLDALKSVTESIPQFNKHDELVFSWDDCIDKVHIQYKGKTELDTKKLLHSSLVSAHTLDMLKKGFVAQYTELHKQPPKQELIASMCESLTLVPNAWKLDKKGKLVFDSTKVTNMITNIIDTSLQGTMLIEHPNMGILSAKAVNNNWVTGNMSDTQKQAFISAINADPSHFPTANTTQQQQQTIDTLTQKSADGTVTANIVINNSALSVAIMKTYVGTNTISDYTYGNMAQLWNKCK